MERKLFLLKELCIYQLFLILNVAVSTEISIKNSYGIDTCF